MNAARSLLQRRAIAAVVLRTNSPRNLVPHVATRTFAVATATQHQGQQHAQGEANSFPGRQVNVDRIRNAIDKLLLIKEAEIKPISTEELEHHLASFANRFAEARACINDCQEAKTGSMEFYEELFTAQKAVDAAFNSYVDLLDDFRRASDDQLKELCQDRLALANSLRTLRQEVQTLVSEQEKSEEKLKQQSAAAC